MAATDPLLDKLELPEFLRVENRVPLTPEQEARVAAAFANVRPHGEVLRRSPEDQAAFDRAREERRQRDIAAMKERLARSREPKLQPTKPPTGATWDIRTSRWVLPGETPPTVADLARAAGPTTRQIMDKLRNRQMTSAPTRPDYAAMTGAQLLAAYNEVSPTKRKAKFSDKAEGLKACERAWSAAHPITKAQTPPAETKARAVEAAANGLRAKAKGPSEGARAGRLAMKIHLKVKDNPRREKTDAYRHFEAMRGGITIAQYLAKFEPEDRRTAAQWLSNTVRDGHAEVVA